MSGSMKRGNAHDDFAGVTLVEKALVPEQWADGAVIIEDGDTVRLILFATRYATPDAAPEHNVVHRLVLPRDGFLWSLRGALALPCAAEIMPADHGQAVQ